MTQATRRAPCGLAITIGVLLALAAAGPAHAFITLKPGSVSPPTITSGDGAVQTIKLSEAAPPGGLEVMLFGDVVYGATTGKRAFVPKGETSVSFPFRVEPRETTTVEPLLAQIAAPGQEVVQVAEVTILPADPATRAVTGLALSADAALDGTTLEGKVELKNPAPAGGLTLRTGPITRGQPGRMTMLPYVTVPDGDIHASFGLTVFATSPWIARPEAHLGTSRVSERLVIVPRTFAITTGGVADVGTVTELPVGIGDAPNLTGATVELTTDAPPGVTVPATVTIPPGSPGAAFPVTVSDSVERGLRVNITATWNGRSVTGFFFTA